MVVLTAKTAEPIAAAMSDITAKLKWRFEGTAIEMLEILKCRYRRLSIRPTVNTGEEWNDVLVLSRSINKLEQAMKEKS